MSPKTKAGQALLEAYRDLDDPMRKKVNFANGIAAIEREAAQQERGRALAAIEDAYKLGGMGYSSLLTIRAILAEPSEGTK